MRRHWTQDEIDALAQHIADGKNDSEIGALLNRSPASVRDRRKAARRRAREHGEPIELEAIALSPEARVAPEKKPLGRGCRSTDKAVRKSSDAFAKAFQQHHGNVAPPAE